jgi:hypothetical protein
MGSRAVKRFGRADGAGAAGSEGDTGMADEPVTVAPMTGGPDAPVGPAPTFQPFTHGGRTFQNETELGAYLEDLHSQISTLQTRPPTPAPAVTPAPVAPAPAVPAPAGPRRMEDMDTQEVLNLVLSDPKGFVMGIKNDMRQEYMVAEQSRQNLRNFWDDFWKDNPELKKFESTVKLVFDGNLKSLGPLQMNEVGPRLAEMTRGTVLSINKDAFGGGSAAARRQSGANVVEGGGNAAPVGRAEPTEPEQPRTLSAIIKQRQRSRNGAQPQPPAKAS